LRKQIGSLKFTAESKEVKALCEELYGQLKGQFFFKFGFRKWNENVSQKIWKESINPKIPEIITELTKKKYEACLEQLKTLFKAQLSHLWDFTRTELLEKFLKGNEKPLLKELMECRHKEVIKKIKEVYPEHTLESLNQIFTNSSYNLDEVVETETKKALEKHNDLLKEKINGGQKLENSFIELKFGATKAGINLDGSCLWVPASIRHDVDADHRRMVYGGVRVSGIGRFINPKTEGILARQTTFAARQLWHNKLVGDAFRDMLAHGLQQHGLVARIEVTKATELGSRRIDIEVWRNGVCLGGIEVKSGNPPRANQIQEARDAWLLQHENYRVNTVYYQYP